MTNQGPSTPVKYYPDWNQGKGGFAPHMGGTRPGNVRPKGKAAFPQANRGVEKVRKNIQYG
tara:strand:+ start:605 stop:787 length:183 start_codon:yes stop_codon:yes gene_type:complete